MSIKPVINCTLLIEEVKKRPCLYDSRGVHGNHEVRLVAWGEIGAAMFKSWTQFTPQEKDTLVKDMQTKWKSLRDNFSRQLRIQEQVRAGILTEPTKKYIYMDQLSFLVGYIQKRDKTQISFDDNKDSNDSMFTIEESKPLCSVASVESVTTQSMQFVPIQPKPTFATATISAIDINSLNNSNVDSCEPPTKKVARVLEELVNIQKDEKADDPMGNRKFLLSLLPFMRKLPDDVNLEVRLQLMSVLQTYTNGRAFQN